MRITKFQCVFIFCFFSSAITDSRGGRMAAPGSSLWHANLFFLPQSYISFRLNICRHFTLICKALCFHCISISSSKLNYELWPTLTFIFHLKFHVSNWPLLPETKHLNASQCSAFCLWGNDCYDFTGLVTLARLPFIPIKLNILQPLSRKRQWQAWLHYTYCTRDL